MDNALNQVQLNKQKNEILLSVVIATYNGCEYIDRCLDSFTKQSISSDLYEVIIVNNNSTDCTKQVVLKYVNLHDNFILLDEEQTGVSYARNKGISSARGKYICFIDDDAYADENWLKSVLYAFENKTPKPSVIGGKILPYYKTEKPAWFNDSFEIRTKGNKSRFLSNSECYTGFPESNYSVKMNVLEEVGSFSTDFGPAGEKMVFGEGSELSRRITKKYPYFWYDPDIIVYHLVRERNMTVKYILSRKYKTAYLYQALRTPSAGLFKNYFTLATCVARVIINAILSIVFVRWFTKKAIPDWLYHIIPLVNCTARTMLILKYYLGIRPAHYIDRTTPHL